MQNNEDFHNQNCFRYLKEIKDKLNDSHGLRTFLAPLLSPEEYCIFIELEEYDATISYANLYHRFLSQLERAIESPKSFSTHISRFDNFKEFINLVYKNQNHNLSETFNYFKDSLSTRRLYETRPESLVKQELATASSKVSHQHTPQIAGSLIGRGLANTARDFKPMLTTSLPTIREYKHSAALNKGVELRFGTQAQRHRGKERLSPLFRSWIDTKETPHVYFNLLGYDRKGYAGSKERALSLALHAAEQENKLYVLTLPADKGLMDQNDYKKQAPSIEKKVAIEEMLAIAMGKSDAKVKDFVVSELVKSKLYPEHNEQVRLTEMLNQSFEALGFKNVELLSPAQKQAVWFHFCKFQFPDFVLTQIKPSTWNASCKDAIDRGGVASAYYNLQASFKTSTPMSREEFEQGLHAAAAMVKARGLNHHYELIWNAVHHYVNANFANLSKDPKKSWLIHWRNDNTPKSLAQDLDYLNQVHKQSSSLLEQISPGSHMISAAIELINEAKNLAVREIPPINKKDRPLALELISHTTQLALDPKHPKKDLPEMAEDLGKRPIFAHVFQRFTYWLRSLVVKEPKTESISELKKKMDQFKTKMDEIRKSHLPSEDENHGEDQHHAPH